MTITSSTTSSPACSPSSVGTCNRSCAARCTTAARIPSSASRPTKTRLRRLRVRASGMAMATATATGNSALATVAAIAKGVSTSTRAGQPQQREEHQRQSVQRRLSGPGGHRRQQESGDHRHGEAEQHLVAVPQRPREVGCRQQAGVLGHPEQHACRGKHAREQIERPKAETPQRRPRHWIYRGRRPEVLKRHFNQWAVPCGSVRGLDPADRIR